jgi:4-oxalocrotonate tautomerase
MPLVDIQLIEGVFSDDQKREMIEKVTDTMVQIEGEAMRGVTWVRVQEFASGAWGIGGKGLRTEDVRALQATTERAAERRVAS